MYTAAGHVLTINGANKTASVRMDGLEFAVLSVGDGRRRLAAGVSYVIGTSGLPVPIEEKVIIEGVEVYSQSVGHDLLNQCAAFARAFVKDDTKPSVTVCGTQTKVTVYLRPGCDGYHHHQEMAGVCNKKADSGTCQTFSPAIRSWMANAQSYKIEEC